MAAFEDDLLRTPKQRPNEAATPVVARRHDEAAVPGAARSILQLQRAAGNAAVAQRLRGDEDLDSVNRARSGGGTPLDASTRVQMEQSFGTDFSDVRVHTDGAANESARQLGAHAYTVGSDVVFASGRYDPGSDSGQRTLAHELTHVVQQRSGPVDGTETGGGVRVSDPSDQFERAAEHQADAVMASRSADVGAAAPTGAAPAVQREGDEEEEVQTLAVQREGDEEEEVQTLPVQREGDDEVPDEEPAA